MPEPVDHLQAVGEIVTDLRELGLEPVLVGGMALVVLGSRRVTRGFAYFFNANSGLRVDLLFDFPIRAAILAEHATRIKIRGHVLDIASEEDLLRLKKIAKAERSSPGDAEDSAFLEMRRKT